MGFTRYIDDLGNSGQLLPPKAWHAHGNAYIDVGLFYPELAEVGNTQIAPCEVKIFMRLCGDSTSGALRAALGIRLGQQPHLLHEAPGMG